jgi:hypothetical protein
MRLSKKSFKVFSTPFKLAIGINDLLNTGRYSFSFRLSENSGIYKHEIHDTDQIEGLLNSDKEYPFSFISTVSHLIEGSCSALYKLEQLSKELGILEDNLTTFYWAIRERLGLPNPTALVIPREGAVNLKRLKEKNITIPPEFDASFIETDFTNIYNANGCETDEDDTSRAEYYKHLSCVPEEAGINFYAADVSITLFQCKEAAVYLNELQIKLTNAFRTAENTFAGLFSSKGDCIYAEYVRLAGEAGRNGLDVSMPVQALDYIICEIKRTALIFENEYDHETGINLTNLDNTVNYIKSALKLPVDNISSGFSSIEAGDSDRIPDELIDSAEKILAYADIPRERATLFFESLEVFRCMKDKYSSDSGSRNVRSSITSVFFEVYNAVLKRVLAENSKDRLYNMFLYFAYMDEKLLKPQEVNALYRLSGKAVSSCENSVYNTKDWLTRIYTMEKDPSINDFGLDYFDTFREMKRRKEVADKDKIQYDNDTKGRLDYEINNMLKTNQKLCHGQMSTYFPIIHSDIITRDLEKAFITPGAIIESLNKILEVDFSAFHREVSYKDPDKRIEKEFIMKALQPDIILIPTYGSRVQMWQEITGRNRNTAGRFLLPAFTTSNLDEMMARLVGNFRWELCRTMMGSAWNDITQKSLTSEYTDYIQFYKKNKDLTEDAKEKIKVQTLRYRNMLREIFTSDYEIWLNYEAKGIPRLNKVVRGILYRNCPLSKPIRSSLDKQPVYSEMAAHFRRVRAKQARELENHYAKYVKSGITLDSDLVQNLAFFKEM